MSVLLEHDEQLERELAGEPFAAPVTGSVLLHIAIAGAIIAYYIVGGFFKSNLWGGPNVGGAIQVNLVSSAIPLPSDVPPNQNVLATEKPSPAPAPPEPKAAAPKVDEEAIPIASKKEPPKPQPQPKPQQKMQQPVQQNKAHVWRDGREQSAARGAGPDESGADVDYAGRFRNAVCVVCGRDQSQDVAGMEQV